jgi:hypothetical protein
MLCEKSTSSIAAARLLFFSSTASPLFAQNKKECRKPPKLVFQPRLTPEDVSRLKSRSLGGRVAMMVNENGDVTDARVLTATPKQGGPILSDAVRTAKFAPRPGCGDLKIDFHL